MCELFKSNIVNTEFLKDYVTNKNINFTNIYSGVRYASRYLKRQGVSRKYRKQILESFDIRTIKIKVANDNTYGLRFYGGNSNLKGKYLFETFSPLINRNNLALPYDWNTTI